jgi:hypothetical protein
MEKEREIYRKMLDDSNIKEFKKVKEFLFKNPLANTIDVSKGTGVEASKIMEFIKACALKIKK